MQRLFLACLLLAGVPNASAALIPITFEGADKQSVGLSGAVLLDDSAWQVETYAGGTLSGSLATPWQWIRGSFGDYDFNGVATLLVNDYPNGAIFDRGGGFDWIFRSQLTSNVIDGVWITNLVMTQFAVHSDPMVEHGIRLLPFSPIVSFSVIFSDGTSKSGTVTVPEPGTLLLLSGGLAAIALTRRKRAK